MGPVEPVGGKGRGMKWGRGCTEMYMKVYKV